MPEWVLDLLPAVGVAVGMYAAIRSDLAYLRAKAEQAVASAESAHRRIDDFFQQRRRA